MQNYIKTDRQIHWLSQVIAKANRTYVPEKKDDSHTSLYYDSIGKRILGRWIETPEGEVILALNLNSLHFEWLDKKQNILYEVSVLNKNAEQLEKSVSTFLYSIKMRIDNFLKPMHFEIPDYKIDKLLESDISDPGLKSWMFFRTLANQACQSMSGYLQSEGEIRIWPHHFDSGVYLQAKGDLGLGFGLATEDSMIGQPYFYLSGYQSKSPIIYKNLSKLSLGKWQTGSGWNGAVLPFSEVLNLSPLEAVAAIQAFIKEATNWFLKQ
ncbi:MAG: hypothetical protein K0B15_06440 [Lentimicrobium sp.]|nr:hypothetical protein [Lentimicrobium sp.]